MKIEKPPDRRGVTVLTLVALVGAGVLSPVVLTQVESWTEGVEPAPAPATDAVPPALPRPIATGTAAERPVVAPDRPLTGARAGATAGAAWEPYDNNWMFGPSFTHEVVQASTAVGGSALQVRVSGPGRNVWDMGVSFRNDYPIRTGERIRGHVWLRDAGTGTPPAQVTLKMEAAPVDYAEIGMASYTLDSSWRRYDMEGVADKAYMPGGFNFAIHLAGQAQNVEIGMGELRFVVPESEPERTKILRR
jgi:hypothetical protein